MLESLAVGATILGGIAALWLFWDKLVSWWGSRRQSPSAPKVVEKWVDIRYPSDSGLQTRLEAAGYSVRWCSDKHLARKVDLEGWEIVVEPGDDRVLSSFRLKTRPDDLTLIKGRGFNRSR